MNTEEENFDLFEDIGDEKWDESEIRSLITLIKANKLLTDKTDIDFWNKAKKDNTWKIIANLLNKTEIDVQKKWKSLRTVFSRKLAQLKVKMASGSGAKEKPNVEWEYWGDMQFLIPHMRHKSNRTSNFHKKPLLVSSITNESLISSNDGSSILKSATETYKDSIKHAAIESSCLQNIDLTVSETSNDSSSHIEALSTSSTEQKMSASMHKTESKKYSSNMKCKRKAPAPDGFYIKKKKEFESCSARMSEASQYLKETLTAVTQSLKEPNGNDDLQYFTCLLPIFKKLNDNQKTECLMTLLNVVNKYGSENKQ